MQFQPHAPSKYSHLHHNACIHIYLWIDIVDLILRIGVNEKNIVMQLFTFLLHIYCHSSFKFLVARLGQNNIRCEMETTAGVPLHFHRWHSSRGAAGIRSRRSLTLKETAMESCATGNKFARSVNKQRSSRSRPPGATTAVVGKHPVSVQFEPRALFGYTRYKVDQVKRGYESSVDIKKYSFGLTAGRVHHLLNSCHIFSSGGVRETASGPTEEETSDLLKECQH
jgi:hypothetical protein